MKRKLLFAMLCIVSALGMRAQTWTASEVEAGDFFLYNVGKGQFLSRGNGWGTQASVSPSSALTVTIEAVGSDYKLRTNVNGSGKGLERLADPVIYTDQSAGKNSTWSFAQVATDNGPVYTIVSKDNHGGGAGSYMTASSVNTVVGPADAVADNYGYWKLLKSWITNSIPVNDANGWTVSQTPTFDGNNVCAEYWNKSGASIKQTVSDLPAGAYELIAVALTRDGMTAVLNAGSNAMNIVTVGTSTVNNRTQANNWFNNGNGVNTLKFTLTEDTPSLEIGLTADNTTGDHWLVWRSFVLIYKGDPTASAKTELSAAIATAQALAGKIPTACYNAINTVVAANNDTYATVDEYETAINNINTALSTYASSAIVADYARYNRIKAAVLALDDDATVFTGSVTVDVSDADTAVEAATTAEGIENAIALLRADAATFLGAVTVNSEKFFTITSVFLENADFSAGNIGGWETNYVSGQQAQNIGYQASSYTNGGVTISQFIEAWRWSPALGDGYLRQTVSGLPEGKYTLECDAIAADQPGGTMPTGAYLYINAAGVDYKTTMATADGKPQHFSREFLSPGGVDVTFGMKTESTTANWIGADNFTVKFYGIDLSPYAALLADAVAEAQAVVEGAVPTAVYNALNTALTTYNKEWTTSAEYTTAIAAIQEATAAATALKASYDRYKEIRTAVLAAAPNTDVANANSQADAATTDAAIEVAVVTLRAALLAELPNVTIPETPGYIDVTAAMVDNASVRQNTNYWTSYKYPSSPDGGSFGKCANNECEFYQQNFKFYQTLALTPGTWEFGVTGFHRAGNHSTYFYAGDDKILIPGVESSVVNTMAQAQTYFDNGNGMVALKFLVETAQDIEIGIDNQDTQTDKWTIFRDFTLKYYGAPDYTVYENEWVNLVTEANTAKTTYANVSGTELTDLNAALADSPAGSNLKATYIAKINALQGALSAFNAAGPSYENYAAYRAETVALFGEALAETVAAPTTAAEALVAVQNLNIAQYNKVATDYTFSATGLIGDFGSWTGTATVAGAPATPNYLDWEHWSGTYHAYYEQASTGWANANGWTIQYQKVCTLPAGDYVIKVAARSSAGTTSSVTCSATDKTISLPNQGSPGRGITTSGVASWSDSDMFANGDINSAGNEPTVGGKGTGWQWRFLPFSLSAQTEVTMTFYAEATSQYQWMSIADGELLSTTKLAQDVNYDETATNSIENTIIADVTVTRNIKAGYNTVVLPFTLTANQVTTAFGAGTEVYTFSEDSADPNDATINFTKGDGSITANTPVLVKATVETPSQVFEGVQIVAASEAKVAGTNVNFVGTYAPISALAAGNYFFYDGQIYKSTGKSKVKAFRAYIENPSGSEVKMFIDGLETAISAINAEAEAEQGAIYNLAGQRVSKAVRGIYVKNGKKVVVK